MSAPRVRFYFDFSCPYAYVASTRIEALTQRAGAELVPCPILLGGVFRARETPQNLAVTLAPAKARHNLADMHRQAELAGVPLSMPAGHPRRTVEALRALLVVGPPFMPLAHEMFRAYWVEGIDLASREGLAGVLTRAGHDAEAVLAKIGDPQIKQELRRRTDEAIEAGVFGVPTCVVETDEGPELFWGSDRLHMVERLVCAITTHTPGEVRLPRPEQLQAPVDLYFDYSSPFAYLGCHRAETLFGDRATWHPMLLGAVFKQVGTANVPMFAQNQAKRRHSAQDLDRQAAAYGARFSFPTRFPMRTVLPLRVTLAAEAHRSAEGRRLVHALFRAYWAEDRDISDPEVVSGICTELGFDGPALVAAASSDQAVKDALFAETTGAVEAGVFGAPTFIVHRDPGPELFWGADRIEFAVQASTSQTGPWP